ncbi:MULTISPECIES: xanthine dehydrogenase family protein molybdopterin-binding subunit [Actinomadura]|uniref:Molybdopterin-dependent oxidoreductase n=1 Tax=Actinomadura litoris TaxID=2678616 RepID=A0A7K1KYI3_9ACTN|nr:MULTISPECIES: xanthine dehydrogenase family protein molybdopterin-binding subunit [Actinomadura]MBT2209076.1 xanthine dehydrogenase family protein molybdopterin-binding subunit [Actinomadura sp. NEAU-AAG7]MUN37107.1 molybdopterin-dependent oxidoreductase [Actinomadura litoris]
MTDRLESREKVTGEARYAVEYPVEGVAYAAAVQATVGRGEITSVGTEEALRLPGVLAVLSCENAPELRESGDAELALFQSRTVSYRGQFVAAVVAETLDTAREAARLVRVEYASEPPDVELRADHPGLYKPEKVNPVFPSDTAQGDADEAFAKSAVRVEATYTTPAEHNNPMEPHATLAQWHDDGTLTLYDSNQGASGVQKTIAGVLGLEPSQVRVVSPHVGGGFGSKGAPRPNVLVAALGARATGRPVKFAVPRQQMFATTGYRTPTIQRIRLGADEDGHLDAITHEVVEQTSVLQEFGEQTAVPTRMMYKAPHRRTSHRLVRLNVPTPSWMRAPGETPGMFALESAMDELAVAAGIDPIELRVRNDTGHEPESGLPFSSRNLVACLREGAARFGWAARDPRPGVRRMGRKLLGTGVASSTYPAYMRPSEATARAEPDGTFTVRVAAADIGTGARTALTLIAAEALKVELGRVRVEVGDSRFPKAPVAGGSMGTSSWGAAVVRACEGLRGKLNGSVPPEGLEASADTTDELKGRDRYARHAFGAQFADVEVDADTGEVRVRRMLGIFAAGRIVNPKTARSQLIGGMTMGIGMALHEESVMDAEFGDFLNRDLAQYHVPACADVRDIEADWVEESDPHLNPMGTKGIGEIGIVGAAAAIANAVHHATGVRVRDLPITPPRLLPRL